MHVFETCPARGATAPYMSAAQRPCTLPAVSVCSTSTMHALVYCVLVVYHAVHGRSPWPISTDCMVLPWCWQPVVPTRISATVHDEICSGTRFSHKYVRSYGVRHHGTKSAHHTRWRGTLSVYSNALIMAPPSDVYRVSHFLEILQVGFRTEDGTINHV